MTRDEYSAAKRNANEVREHYEIEKLLAAKLRQANQEERRKLYSSLYDELFLQVPHHPQLKRKANHSSSEHVLHRKMAFLRGFIDQDSVFMEIGPGDCRLSFEIANYVKQCFGVDVSREIAESETQPNNFHLAISDGTSIPVPSGCVNVAYSNQLMEHLHPDDALEQLRNIYDCLRDGGLYICITPNRLTGPHDISRGFDQVATGFHLKEYTAHELSLLFYDTGFSEVRMYIGEPTWYVRCPASIIFAFERLLSAVPMRLRSQLAQTHLAKRALSVVLVAIK